MFDADYWYLKKNKKFLHNIDTFYYSIVLEDDFTLDGHAANVERVRSMIRSFSGCTDIQPFNYLNFSDVSYVPINKSSVPDNIDLILNYRKGHFARFYDFRLSCPDEFDVYIASVVPYAVNQAGDKLGGSVTSNIVVQIRSEMLWRLGIKLAFDRTYGFVQAFCNYYKLKIKEVKENRIDFCWHTNAISNPGKFFSDEMLQKCMITTLGRDRDSNVHYRKDVTINKRTDRLDVDYVALGKRGDKCFLRMYLKSKEVVEEGYKGWFFWYWKENGLISAYDAYCLEEAYKERRFSYVDIARLKFALEYFPEDLGMDAAVIRQLIDPSQRSYQWDLIVKFANQYTPAITKVYNVEFQCMRKFTKTFQLWKFRDNIGILKRIYDLFDNRQSITEYLTRAEFRLVDPSSNPDIYRCDYLDFWRRLRGTKMVDAPSCHGLKAVRKYDSDLNLQIRKTRAVRSVSNLALAITNNPDTTIYEDAAELLALLNDNDIHNLDLYKRKQSRLHTQEDPPDIARSRGISILDDDGVVLNFSQDKI
ncbi:MAG: hypothetical protein K2O54_07445 [Prevotella sp.]|nr:hypothetical protein [Prevotella sp.]